jgi:hypothetical protein
MLEPFIIQLNTDTAPNFLRMEINTKDNLNKANFMVREDMNGETDLSMMGNSVMGVDKVSDAGDHHKMEVKCTGDNM